MTSLKENPSGISHRYNLGDKEFNSVKNFDGVLCANLDAKILRSKFTRNETKK